MRERPINLRDHEARAILAGRKTQLRRPLNPQPPSIEAVVNQTGSAFSIFSDRHWPEGFRVAGPVGVVREMMGRDPRWKCPFGGAGDLLWVREAWRVTSSGRHYPTSQTTIYVDWRAGRVTGDRAPQRQTHFTCSDEESDALTLRAYGRGKTTGDIVRWRSSTQMPRWASRLTLRVADVRVERVQDITEKDALAAGFSESVCSCEHCDRFGPGKSSPQNNFALALRRAYGRESWNENPFVWVIDVEAVQ